MAKYDKLLREVPVPINDAADLPENLKGLYIETESVKVILLDNKKIATRAEKTCILAEELGHYHTTSGKILDESRIINRKLERRARSWAHEKLVPLVAIIEAHKIGIRSRYEFAEHLQVTEEFLTEAIRRYQNRFGLNSKVGNYTVCFDPLGVIEFFE